MIDNYYKVYAIVEKTDKQTLIIKQSEDIEELVEVVKELNNNPFNTSSFEVCEITWHTKFQLESKINPKGFTTKIFRF